MRDYKSEMTFFLQDFYIERELKPLPITMPVSHYHSYYEIYYLTKGNVRYFIDNTTYDLSDGDIVLIPPNIIHKTSVIDDGSSERLLIWFTADFLEKKEDDQIFDCFKKHHIKNMGSLNNILSSIEAEHQNSDKFSKELIKTQLITLLINLSRMSDNHFNEMKAPSIIQKISNYIGENYAMEITLELLAKEFSISKSHLSRLFKSTTGFGISEYISVVRIKNAERLILSTNLPITEIATRCGFNDSNYFSSVFKKLKGISPLKFRNDNK